MQHEHLLIVGMEGRSPLDIRKPHPSPRPGSAARGSREFDFALELDPAARS